MPHSLPPCTNNTAIVLCTYNGERHLNTQVESLLAQSQACTVLAFDDCSTDSTLSILNSFESDQFVVSQNVSNLGYVKNFEAAITAALKQNFQYIALSDQDDIWNPDRIERGLLALGKNKSNRALLVHSDLSVIGETGEAITPSYFNLRNYRLSTQRNMELILGQNGVMGNTILMNSTLAKLALPFPENLHVHDYWLAVIAELYGKRILLDQPTAQYRLHADNASNSARKFSSLKLNPARLSFWRRLRKRDFKLPFMEDNRREVIAHLLDNSTLPPLDSTDKLVLDSFYQYLQLQPSRTSLIRSMLKSDFLKSSWVYRLRFAAAMLLSKRYS
ncbi:MAG: glycosyltransferase family 2 protein [Granulosicoccaceae bacterium]